MVKERRCVESVWLVFFLLVNSCVCPFSLRYPVNFLFTPVCPTPHPPHGTHSYFGVGPFLRPCGCFLCNWKHTFCSFLCCSPCSWKLYFCFPPLIPWFQLWEEDWVFSLWFWYRVWCTLAQIRWGKKPKQATTVIKNDPLGPSLTSTLTDFSYTFLMYRMYFNVK